MEIKIQEISDLPADIRNLFLGKEMPKRIQAELHAKKSKLEEIIRLIERASGVAYPRVYVRPYAYVTPLDEFFSILDASNVKTGVQVYPLVRFAHLFLEKRNREHPLFRFAVALSAPILIFATKKELTGILVHEFLHYAYKSRDLELYSRLKATPQNTELLREICARIRQFSISIDINSSYPKQIARLDQATLEDPTMWIPDEYLVKSLRAIDSNRRKSLIKRIMNEWFEQGLPCLPWEIEDMYIQRALYQLKVVDIYLDPDMVQKSKELPSNLK